MTSLNEHGDEHIEYVDITSPAELRKWNARQGIECPPEFIAAQHRVIAAARAVSNQFHRLPNDKWAYSLQFDGLAFDELRAALAALDSLTQQGGGAK